MCHNLVKQRLLATGGQVTWREGGRGEGGRRGRVRKRGGKREGGRGGRVRKRGGKREGGRGERRMKGEEERK